jgi:hypothetical protein
MKRTAFVIGNGTSRKKFKLDTLTGNGIVYACNAVYRDGFYPDYLIAVDPKMIHEMVANNIQYDCSVWTNYNKAYEKYVGLNYFTPNKGWSSGPTALHKAITDGCEDIYILGFDFVGLDNGARVNNIYAGSKNYKGAHEPATYYGNWLRQTETCVKTNTDRQFIRVVKEEDFAPTQFNSYKNYKTITYKQLNKILDK